MKNSELLNISERHDADTFCFVLRADLDAKSTFKIVSCFTVYYLAYQGAARLAVAVGSYDETFEKCQQTVDEIVDREWGERDAEAEESEIFDVFLEESCCWLLREDLSEQQLSFLKGVYEIMTLMAVSDIF